MTFAELVETSTAVRSTRSRKQKIAHLADCLRRLGPAELAAGVAYLAGRLPQGKIGLGYAAVRQVRAELGAAGSEPVTVGEVDAVMTAIAEARGRGSTGARRQLLGRLLTRVGDRERDFAVRLIIGELRQGASDGLMIDAVAAAFQLSPAAVRRATMLAGDIGEVAAMARDGGAAALGELTVQLFRPLAPMLAQPVDDIDAVFDLHGCAAFELKLDGARVQLHKAGDEIRVYSRRLNEVTAAVPELVELARSLPARELVVDGETIALAADGRPLPFQTTMRRFGRRIQVDGMRAELPLSVFFFDLLHVDGQTVIDEPAERRIALLDELVPESVRTPRIITGDADQAEAMWRRSLDAGHEGLMAKDLAASYAAGGRGKAWLKLKPSHTLDLVVLAAEWGSGRRAGWLSNLHLGARDPAGGFVMLGKTFKGLTDELLTWQTAELLAREVERDDRTVYVRPELVVEIAFGGVQESPHYPGGMALRFARVKRYRADKVAGQADTIEQVRAIFAASRR